MKKLIVILLVINCQLAIVHSQWIQMPAFPISGSVYDIYFINQNTGWVTMADSGKILKTTNGGAS
jgi:hypothetical protein